MAIAMMTMMVNSTQKGHVFRVLEVWNSSIAFNFPIMVIKV
jgi:hypothetical protein